MSNFGSFCYFQTSLSHGVEQGLQKLPKFDINDLKLLFHCYILIPRKCLCKTPYQLQFLIYRLILLNKLLNDGNTLYRREKYQDAAHRYLYAVRRVPDNFESMEDSKETFEQLKIHLYLNLSRCCRKQGLLTDAVNHATSVLKLKPDCLEALHARARAHRESGSYSEAIQDLNVALRMSPQHRELHKLILKVKEEMNSKFNNNDQLAPIGTGMDEKLKFADDSATSEIGSYAVLSNKKYTSS